MKAKRGDVVLASFPFATGLKHFLGKDRRHESS